MRPDAAVDNENAGAAPALLQQRAPSMSRKPRIVVLGAGAHRASIIALDLASAEDAIKIAKRLAEQTGKAITVRDADGVPIETVQKPTRN